MFETAARLISSAAQVPLKAELDPDISAASCADVVMASGANAQAVVFSAGQGKFCRVGIGLWQSFTAVRLTPRAWGQFVAPCAFAPAWAIAQQGIVASMGVASEIIIAKFNSALSMY